MVAKPMFSRGKFLQNVAQNVCGDKGEKKGTALTISDNLCRPFVWMSAIEKCTAIALRTSFSSDPQTVNNVSQEN